jgi:ribulose 1,5-bisphosphate synthetase/thiazole synthase
MTFSNSITGNGPSGFSSATGVAAAGVAAAVVELLMDSNNVP